MPGAAPQDCTSKRTVPRWLPAVVAILVGLLALSLAYVAHLHGRRVTVALLAVFSVIVVAAQLGLRAGVLAGLLASVTYNLLFTDPYLRFSVASSDDLVPIVALNLSAIASGLIAGRLHDRAVVAEASNRRIAELLKFSQDLQRALSLEEIESIIRDFLCRDTGNVRVSVKGSERSWPVPETAAGGTQPHGDGEPRETRFLLESGEGAVGELTVETDGGALRTDAVRPLLPIVAMATQRCLLAAHAAEADLVRQSEQFKTALLSSVSHDLRTPLAAISASAGSLASLEAQLDDQTRRDLLATIQEQCQRLDRLTTNLLNLGRIDGGLDVSRMPLVDAVEVLGSALARVRAAHPSHSFERDFRTPEATLRADESLLERLFVNVLENAVTHTPPETRIRVWASRVDSSLAISIEDEGPGIPASDWERVFDRFYQGGVNGRRRSGSGLGLSIAKGFAEAIGGSIHAGRPVNFAHGTRIDISLPLTGSQ